MNKQEILRKVEENEGLTVAELKIYQKMVKPIQHVYGKYGTLAKRYLEEHNPAKYWAIDDLPAYLHDVDRRAGQLYDVMYEQLSKKEEYKRTGNFLVDAQRINDMKQRIEEAILNQIVYETV